VSYGASRVYLLTQLVSQVLPPSSENACSDCAVSGVMPQMKKSHEDGFAVDRFLIEELAAIVLEFTDAGNARRLFLPREADNPIFLPGPSGIG